MQVEGHKEDELQWNKISPPFFVLNQALLEKGSQRLAFISEVVNGQPIYLSHVRDHSAAARLKSGERKEGH